MRLRGQPKRLVARIESHKTFDVLLLDVMLPGMDGFSLASQACVAGTFRSDTDADRARAGGRRVARF